MRRIAKFSALMGLLSLASQVSADPQSVLQSVNLHLKPPHWELLATGSNGPGAAVVSLYIDTRNFQKLEGPWIAVHTKELYKPYTAYVTSRGKVISVESVDALNCDTITDIPAMFTMLGMNQQVLVQRRLTTAQPRTSAPNAPSVQLVKIQCGLAQKAFAESKPVQTAVNPFNKPNTP